MKWVDPFYTNGKPKVPHHPTVSIYDFYIISTKKEIKNLN